MTHFDMNMMAVMGMILLMGVFTLTLLKKVTLPLIALFSIVFMLWGDDICSRDDRLAFYGNHFDKGGEIVCKDNNVHPILISKASGWEHKGQYLFKGNRGIEILEEQCEIINQSEPHCIPITTQIIIGTGTLIGVFGWLVWMFRRLKENYSKAKACEELKSANLEKQDNADENNPETTS